MLQIYIRKKKEGLSKPNTGKDSLELASSLLSLKAVSLEWWLQKSDFSVKIWTPGKATRQLFEKVWLWSSLAHGSKSAGLSWKESQRVCLLMKRGEWGSGTHSRSWTIHLMGQETISFGCITNHPKTLWLKPILAYYFSRFYGLAGQFFRSRLAQMISEVCC